MSRTWRVGTKISRNLREIADGMNIAERSKAVRLSEERESELRKLCSTEARDMLAEIDALRAEIDALRAEIDALWDQRDTANRKLEDKAIRLGAEQGMNTILREQVQTARAGLTFINCEHPQGCVVCASLAKDVLAQMDKEKP